MDPMEARAIDRNGNSNGRIDLGDLRARILGDEGLSAVSWEAVGGLANARQDEKSKKSKKSDTSSKDNGQLSFMVLSGSLLDGTPYWAEDNFMLVGN
jgi:hypothetical protein